MRVRDWLAILIVAISTLVWVNAAQAAAPTISSLSITTGAVGAPVTITGSNFGTSQGSSTVKFNGTTATPTSWGASSIVVTVPTGATTGNVVVTVSNKASNGVSFTVVPPPSITSLSISTGAVGAAVTITGTNFGASQGTGTVQFNGTAASVTSWSATSIAVTVPSGATTGNVVVNASGVASNGVNFTVVPPPSIASLSISTGAVGAAVTITGTNFGASQGTGTVKFNGTAASVTSWSATSIAVTVPSGATTGNVVVNASGVASNGVNFTVVSAPSISSVSPTSGYAGVTVTVAGANFGASQGTSTLTFNGTVATPSSWSATSIAVPVPSGATTGNVVVNASGVASNGAAFTVTSLPANWTNGYAYRRVILIDHTKVPNTDQTNFPVLITGAYPDMATTANGGSVSNSNGYDIVLTSDSTGSTTLPFEREIYNPVNGTFAFWVNVPTVSHTADTVVYIFYGNSSVTTDQSNKAAVWDANYVGVWHLPNGTTLSAADSTSNGNNGTVTGVTATSGQIDGGGNFNGSAKIAIQPPGSLSSSFTIEEWAKPSSLSNPLGLFGSRSPSDQSFDAKLTGSGVHGDVGTGASWLSTSADGHFSYAANTWHHVAYVLTTTGYTIYTDGLQTGSGSFSGTPLLYDSTHTLVFGATSGSGEYFSGAIDEIRVSKVARSGDWIATAYNNQNAPNVFLTFGSAATGPGSVFINRLSVSAASPGDSVSIIGGNFGTTQGSSTVSFNGVTVGAQSWSDTAIAVILPFGAIAGPFSVTVNGSTAVSPTLAIKSIPSGWSDSDVGAVGIAGNSSFSTNGTFSVQGAGTGIIGTPDAFHFVYQPLNGDGTIVARVVSFPGAAYYAYAGVMIRESLDPSSKDFFTGAGGSTLLYYAFRSTTGGGTTQAYSGGSFPYWVKVVRSGNNFSGYISADGVYWTSMGSTQTITMAQNVYVGLVVNSAGTTGLATANFDNVSVMAGTPYPTPVVTSVTPSNAGFGYSITIAGSNFGSSQGASKLYFNGSPATTISSWSATQIVATVPTSATTGPVSVVVNGIGSNQNMSLHIYNPVITSLSPPAAQVGGTVTIAGTGFGGSGNVYFNGTYAGINSWTDTSISVGIPSATSGPVTVVIYGIPSNGVQFTFLEPISITSVSPNSGAVGTSVTVTGAGFGPTQSNSVLSFYGGAAATVTSWSDTQIVAAVPSGASTGPVSVQVAGQTAYGPSFTRTSTLSLTDSLGNSTSYTSALIGGVWLSASSQGSGCSSCSLRGTIQNTYDAAGNVLTRTDELGRTTTYTYDTKNNVTSISVPIGNGSNATTSYTYNSLGEVLTATDPLGNVTTNTYDTNGNLLTVTTPAPGTGAAASVTHFAYDTKGELTTITDPLNNATTLTYTAAGLIATITDAQNNVTTYGYDSHGNRTSVTDALNHQTTFAYDAADRLTTITYPGSTTTTFAYDNRGRRTSVTDQNGKTTTYAYDDADRLLTVTDAANNVTTYGYDTESNLTSIKDANNHTTTFAYDTFGRVTQTTFPSSAVETYSYDGVGNLLGKTDRKNQTITYTYDQLNRLAQKTYPDSSTVNYTYDNGSRLTQVTDPTGTYSFTFDNMGRLSGTTTQYAFLTGRSFTTGYSYDSASNRTGFTDPEGGSTAYVYDTLNRLQTLTAPAAISGGSFGFGYDALSRRTSLTRPNAVNTAYSYDNLSRLLSVTHAKGGTTLDGATYAVDNAGNRTAKSDLQAGVTTNYGYDAIYQLLNATQGSTTESYSYDPVGNRLSSLGVASYSYNPSNELTSTSSATYGYDNNGNSITKNDSTGITTYAWDFENRLSSVTLPGTGGTVSFKYDPLGRRIYKSSSSGTSIYAYDGDNLVEETNSSGAAVARYSQGLKIDEPLAMLRSSTTSFYNADGLGSVTSVSNTAGSLTQTYTFDSFGKTTNSTGSLTNPFQYTARELDPESNLYYVRARYFDAATGRFISEDPIQLNGGLNFYVYVRNNPANRRDPKGLKPHESPDPFWPLSWCECELAGPKMPIHGFCLYHCECDNGKFDTTAVLPMEGLLGLKNMCGAQLGCPSRVLATRISFGWGFGVMAPYSGIP
jgi:RHS repeat-associated protein